ncbi:hypothetical protein T11_7391 [Trichinella zimbabwensis]|uniref:Uncharacterized protein n=1 Tax=Trichinella zimbabwensis TaxID=268475 RepID=A0A0V1GY57_9BILA|nr:hypothetical protein T11_7391 [Trichinella zimbabwensis]
MNDQVCVYPFANGDAVILKQILVIIVQLTNALSIVYCDLVSQIKRRKRLCNLKLFTRNELLIKALKIISGYYAFFNTLSALCLLYEIYIGNSFCCVGAHRNG